MNNIRPDNKGGKMANYYVLKKEAVGGYKFDDFYTIKKDNSKIYCQKNKGYKVRTLTEIFDNDRDAVNFAKKYFVSLKKNPNLTQMHENFALNKSAKSINNGIRIRSQMKSHQEYYLKG